MWLCLRFPSLGLQKRILNSPCLLILLIHAKHKTIRWNFGLTPRFYSLEGICSGILTINTRFPPLGLHKGIVNSHCVILFTHTKHKTIRWNLGLTPALHFLEVGELTHWVYETKNLWLIVGQLPIKAGWWNAPSRSGILAKAINKTFSSSCNVHCV